ncbi:MAG: hypothetical protein L7U72_12715 [Rubripirellula sp.]|nr:hypothetical protein [Rubripirellula sp.]
MTLDLLDDTEPCVAGEGQSVLITAENQVSRSIHCIRLSIPVDRFTPQCVSRHNFFGLSGEVILAGVSDLWYTT